MSIQLNDPEVACYIVRHGQTVLNQTHRFRGAANPALDETGIKQAHALAHLFEPIEISHIFCSDKQRSIKTANIIAGAKGIKVHSSSSLNALNVGEFSGQKRTPESEAALEVYLKDPGTQIPGGESLSDFQARIRPCIQEAVEMYFQCGTPPLLVAHSSVVHEVGTLVANDHNAKLVEPGGVLAVFYKNGKLDADAIYRPLKSNPKSHSETIT